jgi:diadenylate cyclase
MLAAFTDWIISVTNAPVFHVPRFGIVQALDILIVAALLYLIMRWIRRTQAWVLLRGIAIILVVALIAEIFDLITVQWIVDNTIQLGLVVVVILFQPELRKALEQIGRGKYLGNLKMEGESQVHISPHTIDEIIQATRKMKATHTGALIVLEQEVDLSEHETSGVRLDAQVSAQLLLNIFEKNTPMHDGAVIIRDNRVSSATCILPLTAETLDTALGTRHRAAVGVSEISDARVVIVSEETGSISLAIGGQITRDVTENQMRDLLIWGEPTRGRLKFFGKNRGRRKNNA